MKLLLSLTLILALIAMPISSPQAGIWEKLESTDKDIRDFRDYTLRSMFFLDNSNNACDSVGIMPFQKVTFAKEFNCSPDSVTTESSASFLEKKLGMPRNNKNIIEFQKDAALLAIAQRYETDLQKQSTYISSLKNDFDKFANDTWPDPKSETYYLLPGAIETIHNLMIPAIIGAKLDPENVNLDEVFSYAVASSPLLSFVKDELKKMVIDSSIKQLANPVVMDDFNSNKIAELLSLASHKASIYLNKEVTEIRELSRMMKSSLSSEYEADELKILKEKYTEKLVVNNPKLAAEVIDGIVMTPSGTKYVPTSYSVLARGLCELESKHFEKKANDVKNDFLLNAATTPLTFVGGGIGALYMIGHTVYAFKKTVPSAFQACIDLKEQFQGQNAIELSEALKKPLSEMGSPPSPAEAQAIALSECTRNASMAKGMAIVQAGLTAAGLGSLGKTFQKMSATSKAMSVVAKTGKVLEKTALWGGRGLGAASVGMSTAEVVKNCYGDKIDAETCRVSKLNLAMAGVTLIGSEINMKHKAKLEANNKLKMEQEFKEQEQKKQIMAKLEFEKKIQQPVVKKVTMDRTDTQKQRFFSGMRDSSKHVEVKGANDKADYFKTLQPGDEIRYFDPHFKKEMSMFYVGDESGKKVFVKDPSIYLGGVQTKLSSPMEFHSATGIDDPIFIAKSQAAPHWEDSKRMQLPQNGNFLVFKGKEGKQKVNFPARVVMDDREQINSNGQALRLPSNNKKLVNEVVVLSREKDTIRGKDGRLQVKEFLIILMPNGKVRKIQTASIGGADRTAITPFFTGNPDQAQEVGVPMLENNQRRLPGN